MAAGKPAPPPIGRSRQPVWPIAGLPGGLIDQWELRGGAGGWSLGQSISMLLRLAAVSFFRSQRRGAFNFYEAKPAACLLPRSRATIQAVAVHLPGAAIGLGAGSGTPLPYSCLCKW